MRRIGHEGSLKVAVIKDETIVDLYTYPLFAWIIYSDSEHLLEEAEAICIQAESGA